MKHFNVLFLLLLIINFSCNEDYNTVGIDLVSTSDFNTKTEYFPVYSKTDSIADLQSDRQIYMHIGQFTLPFLEGVQQISQHKLIFHQIVFLEIFLKTVN